MSAWTTRTVPREEAKELLSKCIAKELIGDIVNRLSDSEIDEKLNKYAYTEEYVDILGLLYNFEIERDED